MLLVSACLLGNNCKYNGKNNENENVIKYTKGKEIIPICPEQLGGLKTPRDPAEIVGGTGYDVLDLNAKVITLSGDDVTKQFLKGAYESLKIAKLFNCKEAILKANSPSCSCGKIYDGTFQSHLIDGYGITGALLKKEGVIVKSEEDI